MRSLGRRACRDERVVNEDPRAEEEPSLPHFTKGPLPVDLAHPWCPVPEALATGSAILVQPARVTITPSQGLSRNRGAHRFDADTRSFRHAGEGRDEAWVF